MSNSHWAELFRRRAQLTPPLRPNREVAEGLGQAIAGHGGRVLLLGVTPELVELGSELIAVDRSDKMIADVWPGDTPRYLLENYPGRLYGDAGRLAGYRCRPCPGARGGVSGGRPLRGRP